MDKYEAEQHVESAETVAAEEQLIVEIPTEIRAGVAVASRPTTSCGGSYACYNLRAS
jgi:hypothetical protein